MTLENFFLNFTMCLILLPIAVLCLIPVKNQLRFPFGKVIKGTIIILGILISLLAFVFCFIDFDRNIIFIPIMIGIFLLYKYCLNIPFVKALSIFMYVLAYISIISNLAHCLTGLSYIGESETSIMWRFILYQTGLSFLFALLTGNLLSKYASKLIDYTALNRVWWITIPISTIILVLSLRISPRKYETLYVNYVYIVYWYLIAGLFLLMLFLSVIFYFIVSELHKHMKEESRSKVLELQESHFLKTQRYLDETARVRHDFKHTVYTLKTLADEEKLDSIREYLDEYIKSIPQKDIVSYCKNYPLNALLNHYATIANEEGIRFSFQIDLPDTLHVTDIDLCNIVGNILENAVNASKKLPRSDRFMQLVSVQNHNSHIYIISENTFDGKPKKKNESYLSTNTKGRGIGLSSILSTAENYGGTARFYNDDKKFYSEVVL